MVTATESVLLPGDFVLRPRLLRDWVPLVPIPIPSQQKDNTNSTIKAVITHKGAELCR